MDAASFIDIVLTPIGAGLGGFLGLSMGVKKQPEKFASVAKVSTRLLVGILIALAIFATKIL